MTDRTFDISGGEVPRHALGSIVDLTGPEPPKTCHFMRVSLEIKNEIYRMLLTTLYCTRIAPNSTSLEFRLNTNILLANKDISAEATRVLLEGNHFVIIKVTGLKLRLEKFPAFRFLAESRVTKPMLHVGVNYTGVRRSNDSTLTLITTPEGLPSFITALWGQNLTEININDPDAIITVPPSSLVTLDLNVKAPLCCETLMSALLKPWECLHGIKDLRLIGNIGDSTRQRLQRTMREGPFPAEIAVALNEYDAMGQEEMTQKDYVAAKWWWNLRDNYLKYLAHLSLDPSFEHRFKDDNSELWDELWWESGYFCFQDMLVYAKTCIQESRYKEALSTAESATKARGERVFPPSFYGTVSPLLTAKFCLCEALAHTMLEETNKGRGNLLLAAAILSYHGPSRTTADRDTYINLQTSINTELFKLKSPYQLSSELPLANPLDKEPDIDSQPGIESRSFWEWLDLPEEPDVVW